MLNTDKIDGLEYFKKELRYNISKIYGVELNV